MRSTCETPEQSQRRAAGGGGSGGKAIGQGEWVVAKQVLNTVSEETDGMASSTTVQDGKPPLLAKGRACSRLTDLQIEQLRIRQAAQKDKKLQFTALWHHVYNVDCLRDAYILEHQAVCRAGARRSDVTAVWRKSGGKYPGPLRSAEARSVPRETGKKSIRS